jgi:zinc finger protein
VKIPELQVEITPGPQAESYVSNVDGILKRVEEATKTLFTLTRDEQQKIRQLNYLEKIRKSREGKIPFTLILMDPHGTSAIIAQNDKKIKKRRLTKREIESLTRFKRPQTST